MNKPYFPQDFVHSDFPEPITTVKGIEVKYWDGGFATPLLKKYFPGLYLRLFGHIDHEV